MRVPCPTCGRLGRVPKRFGAGTVMGYYNPSTGDCWPHETCQTCMGSGWVNDDRPVRTDAQVEIDGIIGNK